MNIFCRFKIQNRTFSINLNEAFLERMQEIYKIQ